MLGPILLAVTIDAASKATCEAAYGQLACGYGCTARYGQLQCADWPGGACLAAYGRVECGPAAPPGFGAGDPDARFPAARCIAHAGKIVCGWDCKTQFAEARCASWPGGACIRHRDTVVCGPEPPAQWWRLFDKDAPRFGRATCVNHHDQVACGWSCVERYGKVACLRMPG